MIISIIRDTWQQSRQQGVFILMLIVTVGQTFWERRQVHYGG